ncbi:MAG: hypothetical protein AA931_03300 [Peptococcaceae bacterium 1109]|nr:MAG: hypothetical protein AA931_03300 [Peptococcaceae bacterium 1109]
MCKIIKAADLKVLVPEEASEVIRPVVDLESSSKEPSFQAVAQEGTILEASDLISQAKAKAEAIVKAAEEEGEALRSQSLLDAEELRQHAALEGYEEGYKAGLAEGKARADQEAARLLNLLRDFVDKAAADRANALAKLEEDFLKLSLILAEKIVRNTIKDDPAWLKPVIEEACQKLGTVDECIVRLSPVEYEALKDQELRLGGARVERLSLRPDPTLKPGDCVIETESGTVDASLEKRLGKLAEHLLEVIYDGQ